MAGEEDVELRDLVAQSLEAKGVLGKIRAQLRASVFLALEEQESQEKSHPLVNEKLQEYLKTKDGKLAVGLVREFLEFFELDFTCAVFDPETNALETYSGREQLAKDIGVDHQSTANAPLLASVLQRTTQPPVSRQLKFPEPLPFTSTQASFPPPTITESSRTSASVSTVADTTPLVSVVTTTTTKAHTDTSAAGTFTLSGRAGKSESAQSTGLQGLEGRLNGSESSLRKLDPRTSELTSTHPSRKQPSDSGSKPLLGEGGFSVPGVFAELGETFVNSSLDVERLLNSSGEMSGYLKQPREAGSAQDELDDFFASTTLHSARDPLSKEKEKPKASRLAQDEGLEAAMLKKGGVLSSLKDAPSLPPSSSLLAAPPLSSILDKRHTTGKGFEGQLKKLTVADGINHEDFHSEGGGSGISEHIEESSLPLSSLASGGNLETADLTMSENSLSGDFDYEEPIQS